MDYEISHMSYAIYLKQILMMYVFCEKKLSKLASYPSV